jgi:photosynthetic reaction center cytochrome c subunit
VYAGNKQGQNTPGTAVGMTSLPYDPFKDYLAGATASEIRIQSPTALPTSTHTSIQQTEQTYGLMVHISESLGVNCTHCHNSRSFMPWEASSPARATAWHAIRMVRDINEKYITPLTPILPASGKGPDGDALKVNCETCHRGVVKPLYGVNMLKDYPELAAPGPLTPPVATEPVPEAAPEAAPEPDPAAEAAPEPPPAS